MWSANARAACLGCASGREYGASASAFGRRWPRCVVAPVVCQRAADGDFLSRRLVPLLKSRTPCGRERRIQLGRGPHAQLELVLCVSDLSSRRRLLIGAASAATVIPILSRSGETPA